MRARSTNFDLDYPERIHPRPEWTAHDSECATCGEMASNGAHCLDCIGQECGVCGFPIYHDESYTNDAHGLRHSRCSGEAQPRPADMCKRKRMMHTVATSTRKARR